MLDHEPMSAKDLLLRRIADLGEEDARALLAVVDRLCTRAQSTAEPSPEGPRTAVQHPERFGALRGSVRIVGDVEAPTVEPEQWTFDAENVGS